MGEGTRTMQSTDDGSVLLKLKKELELCKDTAQAVVVQKSIDEIVARNFLAYVNR